MQITLSSIVVEDQDRALRFYTEFMCSKRSMTSPWASPAGSL